MNEEVTDNNDNKKKTRKRRKNFLANAKKYAKKGQMGRGTKMSDELYQYFVGILDAIKQGIKDPEQRQALVDNVLDRTKNEEPNVVGNQLGCRVVELLLPYASAEDLERFMEVLSPDLRKLCSDNFTSHVIETILRVSCERATEEIQDRESTDCDSEDEEERPKKKKKLHTKVKSKYSKDHIKCCYDFTLKICKYALNNLEDFVWDQYANFILRTALKCLSGITLLPGEKPKVNLFKETVGPNKGIPPHQTKMQYKDRPQEFKDIVIEFANRLSAWPQFKDLPYQNTTSALIQVLLYAVKNTDKSLTKNLIKKLLNESFVPSNWDTDSLDEKGIKKIDVDENDDAKGDSAVHSLSLPPVFESEAAVRCLEAALFVAKKKMYTQIYATCFINRLGQLATMAMLNFTVQRLIDNCQIKEEFEPMFDELAFKFSQILDSGNTGVLVALAKACHRIMSRQAQFIQNLKLVLKCNEPDNQKFWTVLCLRMQPLDKVDINKLDKEYFITVHGSVILQSVLEFQRPTEAVNSLLELTPEQLVHILTDAKGCHVADAFCRGVFVGIKARDKLVWKLRGYYQKLALSQYGSRALEEIFQAASTQSKIKLMTELAEKSSLLNSTPFGRVIANKLDVATFKLSPAKWEQGQLKCLINAHK